MDDLWTIHLYMDDDWGYPHFRKPPFASGQRVRVGKAGKQNRNGIFNWFNHRWLCIICKQCEYLLESFWYLRFPHLDHDYLLAGHLAVDCLFRRSTLFEVSTSSVFKELCLKIQFDFLKNLGIPRESEGNR